MVRVITCGVAAVLKGVLGKVSEVGFRLTTGAGITPVPVRVTVCGESEALSVRVMDAVKAPAAAGMNLTLMVQVPLTAMLVQLETS